MNPVHYLYFERQIDNFCGVHCINNLLGGHYFEIAMLMELADEIDKREQLLLSSDRHFVSNNRDLNGGNFNIEVLILALEKCPSQIPIKLNSVRCSKNGGEILSGSHVGFVVHTRGHWIALRIYCTVGISGVEWRWFNLDSSNHLPEVMSSTYLEMYLQTLLANNDSVYSLNYLPEPLQPDAEEIVLSSKISSSVWIRIDRLISTKGGISDSTDYSSSRTISSTQPTRRSWWGSGTCGSTDINTTDDSENDDSKALQFAIAISMEAEPQRSFESLEPPSIPAVTIIRDEEANVKSSECGDVRIYLSFRFWDGQRVIKPFTVDSTVADVVATLYPVLLELYGEGWHGGLSALKFSLPASVCGNTTSFSVSVSGHNDKSELDRSLKVLGIDCAMLINVQRI